MDLLNILPRVVDLEERIEALNKLESELKYKIPPFLMEFYRLYNSNSFYDHHSYKYFNSDINRVKNFIQLNHTASKGEYGVLEFFKVSELVENMKEVYEAEHEIWGKNFIAIAECFNQGYLLVGVGQENEDKVFMEYGHKHEMEFVANNIIQYVADLKIEVREKSLARYKNSQLKDLYKNWNEDFWRIKGDEIT